MKITHCGPGRIGFVLTNGKADCLVLDDGDKDEYRARIAEGWRIVRIQPICRSQVPKLIHQTPELVGARAFSYTLVILEAPKRTIPLPQPWISAWSRERGS